MNLLEHYVTEIISKPYFKYNKWLIDVNANCYGKITKHSLMFETESACYNVVKGYIFLS